MKFLAKNPESSVIVREGWTYISKRDNSHIQAALRQEQYGFCAYSEKYLGFERLDGGDIEHFDPRLKDTPNDNYFNWYLVDSRLNQFKYKKLSEDFLPIINPACDAVGRVVYRKGGLFEAVNNNDMEALNFIRFLKLNDELLVTPRQNHIQNIKKLRNRLGDDELFLEILADNWQQLNYITALEVELNLPIWDNIRPSAISDIKHP